MQCFHIVSHQTANFILCLSKDINFFIVQFYFAFFYKKYNKTSLKSFRVANIVFIDFCAKLLPVCFNFVIRYFYGLAPATFFIKPRCLQLIICYWHVFMRKIINFNPGLLEKKRNTFANITTHSFYWCFGRLDHLNHKNYSV